MRPPRRSPRGFTLLEIVVALTMLAVVVTFVYQVLQNAVRGQEMVRTGLRKPKIENAILGQIFRDFRYLYWDGFTGNGGFVGRSHTIGPAHADSIDFVTARPSRSAVPEDTPARDAVASPLTEVGYACRPNDQNPQWIELWRREDWSVDPDPTGGGRYTLVYDRILKFELQYFLTPLEQVTERGAEEWDTRAKGKLPYAIVLDIQFDVEERSLDTGEDEPEMIRRIILLKGAYNVPRAKTPAGE